MTRNRLYLETMENVFGNTSKVLIDSSEGGNNLLYLPLDKLMSQAPQHRASSDTSASDYGIELESSQPVAPASNNTRQSTTRQGRY